MLDHYNVVILFILSSFYDALMWSFICVCVWRLQKNLEFFFALYSLVPPGQTIQFSLCTINMQYLCSTWHPTNTQYCCDRQCTTEICYKTQLNWYNQGNRKMFEWKIIKEKYTNQQTFDCHENIMKFLLELLAYLRPWTCSDRFDEFHWEVENNQIKFRLKLNAKSLGPAL